MHPRIQTRGNLVNWDNSSWILDEGTEWIEKSVDDVCLLPKPKDVVFPEDRTNEEMHLLCKKLRGHMSVTDNQAKQDALAKEYQRMLPEKYDEGWKGKFMAPVRVPWHLVYRTINFSLSFSYVLGRFQ